MKKKSFILWFLFTLGYVFCNVNYPLTIQRIMDSLTEGQFGKLPLYLSVLLLLLVVLVHFCRRMTLEKARYINEVKQEYREGVLRGIFANNRETLSSEQEGEFLSLFNNDIPMVVSDYHDTLTRAIYSMLVIVFAFSAIVSVHPLMAALIFGQMLLLTFVPRIFRKKLQEQKTEISDSLKRYNVKLKDSIFCLPIIRSYLAEKELLLKTNEAGVEANEADYAHKKTATWADFASMSIGYGGDFLLYSLGALLIMKGYMTIGGLLAVTQITNVLANPITTIAYNFNTMNAVKPVRKSILQLMKQGKKNSESVFEEKIETVELDSVVVEKNGTELLHDIDLKLEKGKKYLLVGANGCGKSTLLKVLNRNIREKDGVVKINGKICSDFLADCAMVYQEPYLFTGTVKENITLGQNFDKELYEQLLDFCAVRELMDKEEVQSLSGGEKQKVALCRALLREPGLLLLDEAFSAMDSGSRSRFEDSLLRQKMTMVNIQHSFRREAVMQYDAVIFMSEGRISEIAPYEKLSEKARSHIPFE